MATLSGLEVPLKMTTQGVGGIIIVEVMLSIVTGYLQCCYAKISFAYNALIVTIEINEEKGLHCVRCVIDPRRDYPTIAGRPRCPGRSHPRAPPTKGNEVKKRPPSRRRSVRMQGVVIGSSKSSLT
eukprot:6105505-Amphidinium_carterae.1